LNQAEHLQAALAEDANADASESNPGSDDTGEAAEEVDSAELKVALSGSNTVPLRHLVYRVHKLPPSLRTYIYDFGSLTSTVEQVYIKLKIQKGLDMIASQSKNYYAVA
jgi:hypothetical protein